jgi:hypothetical protein
MPPTGSALPAGATPGSPTQLPLVVLDVELFYHERWMRVHQTVSLVNTSGELWTEIVFNVPIHYLADVFFLDAMTVMVDDAIQEGTPPFLPGEAMLHVPLPVPAENGAAVSVEMFYRVVIPAVSPVDVSPLGNIGWGLRVVQAGEFYPALTLYWPGVGWSTWDYHPVGDPTFYPLTDIDLVVHVEEDVTVISGNLPERLEDGAWHFQIENARGVAFLASDQYQVSEAQVNGIPIQSAYFADEAAAGQAALDIAARSVALFEELYGPYPYPSLTIAENGYFGSMEYTGLVSITDYAYLTYWGVPSVLDVLVTHEIAHQWWYGATGNDQVHEPWLDESLAFYSELLYFERYHPDLVGWWWENRVEKYHPDGPVDATIYSYADTDSFIFSMYGQAARFLRDLRQLMGDDAFFAFLQDYAAENRWKIVTADDFFAEVRQHTDQDLSGLLTAYFANPDH